MLSIETLKKTSYISAVTITTLMTGHMLENYIEKASPSWRDLLLILAPLFANTAFVWSVFSYSMQNSRYQDAFRSAARRHRHRIGRL